MPKTSRKKKVNYVTIKLPESIVKMIDEVIESNRYAYVSRADFVMDAVRKLLRELGYFPRKKGE